MERKTEVCFCLFTDVKQHQVCKPGMIYPYKSYHGHTPVHDITGADFKNSLYTLVNRKRDSELNV